MLTQFLVMTAKAYPFDYQFLADVSTRIINETPVSQLWKLCDALESIMSFSRYSMIPTLLPFHDI